MDAGLIPATLLPLPISCSSYDRYLKTSVLPVADDVSLSAAFFELCSSCLNMQNSVQRFVGGDELAFMPRCPWSPYSPILSLEHIFMLHGHRSQAHILCSLPDLHD